VPTYVPAELELGHVVLSKWVLRCCSQPLLNTIIVAFLWLSIISSDIVFEVETYKYKAVAQLIKTLPADCWIHSFMIARRMSQPPATDQGVRSVSSTFHHFPWPKITQREECKIWWGRWEMWVYQRTKPWLVSLIIASKSSYKLSRRIPSPSRHYSDNAVLKLANN